MCFPHSVTRPSLASLSCVSLLVGSEILLCEEQEGCHCQLLLGWVRAACTWFLWMQKQKQECIEDPPQHFQLLCNVATWRLWYCLWLQVQGTVHASHTAVGWSGDALSWLQGLAQVVRQCWGMTQSVFSAVLLRLHYLIKGAFDLARFSYAYPFQLPPRGELGDLLHLCPTSNLDNTSCCQRPELKGPVPLQAALESWHC